MVQALIRKRILSRSSSGSLLRLAAVFLGFYALALTLAPVVRARSFQGLAQLRWGQWLGLVVWLASFWWLQRQTRRQLPDHDSLLLPVAALLTGWGLLSIWRLTSLFGLRQTAWVALCTGLFSLALNYKDRILPMLRRYKYLWLTTGFSITALTLLFGTNPSGEGAELWLGCCGVYFQPSEPLKLLLIVYLAAYLADRQPLMSGLLPLLAPTALMAGMALLLLLAQRDLGTAWVFIFLYATMIYIATGQRRILLISVLSIVLALFAGYELFPLVHARIEAWLNPWVDPSGGAYQIVQALLAMASGGFFGRGPGLGSPNFVPVAHSDFIYTSIVEENGLLGAVALLLLVSLLVLRALRIALQAREAYPRYLAVGLGAYLAAQSLLIIGGTIRMLPLTGVTLPFVSYGGSSMLTSFAALLLLMLISQEAGTHSAPVVKTGPTLTIGAIILAGLGLAAVFTGWWSFVRGPDLLTRPDNARRALSDEVVRRGSLLDRNGQPLALTQGEPGDFKRVYPFSEFSSALGYSSPVYGQAGLEKGLDPILRGEAMQPAFALWWNHLLYGQPSPGLDVRLSLDAGLQEAAVQALDGHNGAAILLDARSGEILAMTSQPGYDANTLEENWGDLLAQDESPLVNRALQGGYPPGTALAPFVYAAARDLGVVPPEVGPLDYELSDRRLHCLRLPADEENWQAVIAAGCPGPLADLGLAIGGDELLNLYQRLGFLAAPQLRTATFGMDAPASITRPGASAIGQGELRVSPLQMALAAATLSNYGREPAAQLALEVRLTNGDWTPLETLATPTEALDSDWANATAQDLADEGAPIWQVAARAWGEGGQVYSWYLGGSLPAEAGDGQSLVVVVLLEENAPFRAQAIGRGLLLGALGE